MGPWPLLRIARYIQPSGFHSSREKYYEDFSLMTNTCKYAGLGSSVGCVQNGDQEVVSSRLRSGTILSVRLIINLFYGHSLPFADSKRAVVSYWQKNGH